MQHLDEGTIHAWLDGALTADEAARVEQHSRACATCAAMVAEARGLVAGSSRILSALDEVPAVVPGGVRGAAGGAPRLEESDRRALRPPPAASRPIWSRPAILAAAASVVVMVGSVVVVNNMDSGRATSSVLAPETASDAATQAPDTFAEAGAEQRVAPSDGRAGSASTPSAPTRRVVPLVGTASGGRTRAQVGAAPPSSQRRAETDLREMVAQKAAGAGKAESAVPLAPPPADASARFADAPAPASADKAVARPSVEGRGAIAQRAAAARSERVVTTGVSSQPMERASRGDTSYRLRVDTVTVTQTDTVTVVVEAPRPPNLRDPAAPIPAAVIRISGCYVVLEGRFPKAVTLTTERVWSGAAEQQFVAKASGATGYWSQPRSGDVYIALAGAIANARIDPSTGELRGKVHRGGSSERFAARRGCR